MLGTNIYEHADGPVKIGSNVQAKFAGTWWESNLNGYVSVNIASSPHGGAHVPVSIKRLLKIIIDLLIFER